MFPLIIQRTLVLLLYIAAATHADQDSVDIPFAMDATYAGIHAPTALRQIIILGWIWLVVAAISAWLDRVYKWPKMIMLFAGLTALMIFMNLNTLWVYEPYITVRR